MVEKVARARAKQAKMAKVLERASKALRVGATPAGAPTTTVNARIKEIDQSGDC